MAPDTGDATEAMPLTHFIPLHAPNTGQPDHRPSPGCHVTILRNTQYPGIWGPDTLRFHITALNVSLSHRSSMPLLLDRPKLNGQATVDLLQIRVRKTRVWPLCLMLDA